MQDRESWATPQQPAAQQAPGQVSLHGAAQQPARAPFLAERRGLGIPGAQPAPPTGQPVPGAAPAPYQAPAASASPAAAQRMSAAQAFEQARQAQLGQPAAPVAPAVPRTVTPQSFEPVAEAPANEISAPAPAQPAPVKRPVAQPAQPGAAPGARVGMSQSREEGDLDLQGALRYMLSQGASDLHVTSGAPPMIRIDGGLKPIPDMPRMTPEGLQRSLYAILTLKQREQFEEVLELDLSYSLVGESRFRVNMFQQRDSVGAVFRMIPYEIKPLEALGIPEGVSSFAALPRGLVLVTGPTGSGKSTTLASLIDLANRTRSAHIMTVEDPIEFLHRHKRSLINQREVGADTRSFKNALKHVLRQDPDIILVGEMRDLETISVALTAAETGHLVFATLHTQDAAQTIDRIIDVFPAEQQGQVRTQLATAIQGVVCQTLVKRSDGPGRAVATEIMFATPAIRNLIREGKTHQIYTSLQAGASLGMQTMDQALADLVKRSMISYETGVELCHSVDEFSRLAGKSMGARL
ncbi:type IV pilus twitching motility protein PilT [Demequina iriomotensis]|uniref:type IV pilus twitching motility protein PilT n=1 Tax=Demequina iriomotensis TaxID=1536641 RepID=UPI0009E647B6|nr:type IV pilus twitching motility protein PilT [Demequina iriomotensis]